MALNLILMLLCTALAHDDLNYLTELTSHFCARSFVISTALLAVNIGFKKWCPDLGFFRCITIKSKRCNFKNTMPQSPRHRYNRSFRNSLYRARLVHSLMPRGVTYSFNYWLKNLFTSGGGIRKRYSISYKCNENKLMNLGETRSVWEMMVFVNISKR